MITNTSKIKDNALVKTANQTPFTLTVDTQHKPTVTLSISVGGATVASDLEMMCYKESAPYYYFLIDLKDFLSSLFVDDIDDETQSEWNWKDMDELLEDVTLDVTSSNGVDEDETLSVTFTALDSAAQFGDDIMVVGDPDDIYDLDQSETLYVGLDNIGYAYVLTKASDNVSTSQEDNVYFIDSDDYFLTGSNDELTFETI